MTDTLLFPPVESAGPEGILALGGDLRAETLVNAYTQGIFPWPISDEIPLAWFAPDPRGVLFLTNLHVPQKLKKTIKKGIFNIRYNNAFEEVINQCADCANRPGQTETWITKPIIDAYISLHKKGKAYSVESYHNGELVGGLYGVCIGNIISGESMFYKRTDASKVALVSLVKRLAQHNIPFLDTQMITPIVKLLGGEEISRESFMEELKKLKKNDPPAPSLF